LLAADVEGQLLSTIKVNAGFTATPLMQVVKQLETKIPYRFAYNRQELNSYKVTIAPKERTLDVFLDQVLKETPLNYKLVRNKIVLYVDVNRQRMKAVAALPPTSVSVADKIIHGVVTNISGVALPGVTITIKNRPGTGTITDQTGNFQLKVSTEAVLLFKYIGFEVQEISVKQADFLTVKLLEDKSALNEVVVVGYGTQKKLTVTGAVTSINTKELKQTPGASLNNSLVGRLPGLIAVQNSGEPGADAANLYIRGYGTYGSMRSPLTLVDGIQNSFNNLDPNEVESVTVLKDAAATALYGMLGANGVILVTTKRGKIGKPAISLTTQMAVQSPTRLPKYLDSYDALKLYREGLINDGLNANMYSEEYLAKFRDRSNPTYEYLYPNVNWTDELLKPYSLMSQANLNVNGGSSNARYFVSMSYVKQNGLYNYENQIKDYNMQAITNKYNFRANVDVDITKNLSMELNLGDVIRDRNYPSAGAGSIFSAMRMTPSWYYPLKNPDGSIPGVATGLSAANPYGLLTQNGYQRLFENTLQAVAGFTLKIPYITGLSIRTRLAFDAQSFRNVTRNKNYSTFQFTIDENATDLSQGRYINVATGTNTLSYDVAANGSRKTTWESYLNYDRNFNKHAVNAMLRYSQSVNFTAESSGVANAILGLPYKALGLVGRFSYAYNDRYLAEVNIGYNGSENFRQGKRMGLFPAFSLGWVISNENFMKEYPIVSLLKIRGSAGIVGNETGNNRFSYLSTWTTDGGSGYRFGVNRDGDSYSSAEENQAGNPALTWEKAKKMNAGLDLELLKGTIHFTGDIFSERRTDILTPAKTIPSLVGIASVPSINAGIVVNRGFEAEVSWRKPIAAHQLFFRFNYSYARNKIVYSAEPDFKGREWQAQRGHMVNEAYGLTALGLFKDADDIAKSPKQSFGNAKPGDIKYKDMNGDGVINDLDAGYLGTPNTANQIAGFTLGYSYKNIDLNILFQAALGGTIWMTGSSVYAFDRNANVLADYLDGRWTPEDPDPNAKWPRMSSVINANNQRNSTFWLRSSDYVRLKTVEIGYTLPKRLMDRLRLQTARCFINGVNLLTWDKIKIFDPEIPDGTGNYPQQRVVNLGINVTL
jgi:TonB-linked SusC/RagA family outer membrane protein